MRVRETLWFCLLMAGLLGAVYGPQMLKPGGITFGTIQDFTNVYGFYPWDVFTSREIRVGYFPLWNPHNALGEPHLANMQSAVFYPLTWLKVIANVNLTALDILLVLRLFLAGLFAYLFLGDLKLNFWGRAFGAASFATTGYFTRYVYMSHLNVEILIPLLLLCFGKLARERRLKWFVLSSLSVWLSIVGGFPEATLYALLLAIGWYYYRVAGESGARTQGALALCGVLAAGLILSLPQLLPFIEYMANAWFYHGDKVGMARLKLRYVFSLLVPWFWGTNDVSPLVPWLAPYIGMGTAAFAFMGKLRKTGPKWFFIIAGAALAGIIYGVPPFAWLGRVWPFSITLNYKYAVPAMAFCISALAGLGMDEVMERKSSSLAVKAVAGVAAAVILMLVINGLGWFEPFKRLSSFRWLWYYAVLLGAIASLPAAARAGRHGVNMAIIFLFIIYPASGNRPKHDDAVERASAMAQTRLMKKNARFAAEGSLIRPDLNLLFGLNDIRYYHPMYLKNYVDAFKRANGLETEEELARNFDRYDMFQPLFERLDDPLWRKMALGYWLGDRAPSGWEKTGDRLYKRPASIALYKGESCAGERAQFIPRSSQFYDIVDGGTARSGGANEDVCPGGRLVVSFARYPGWRAWSGGEIKIGVEDGVFMSTAARGRVSFEYKPPSFAIGLWAFIAGIAFLLTMAVMKNTLSGEIFPDLYSK